MSMWFVGASGELRGDARILHIFSQRQAPRMRSSDLRVANARAPLQGARHRTLAEDASSMHGESCSLLDRMIYPISARTWSPDVALRAGLVAVNDGPMLLGAHMFWLDRLNSVMALQRPQTSYATCVARYSC